MNRQTHPRGCFEVIQSSRAGRQTKKGPPFRAAKSREETPKKGTSEENLKLENDITTATHKRQALLTYSLDDKWAKIAQSDIFCLKFNLIFAVQPSDPPSETPKK